jgi:farnesyl-diphosphate farnesyltransferase
MEWTAMKAGAGDPNLSRDLLRRVSRSFYLSLRVLPAAVRPGMGLGYLLARASDTLADSAQVPASQRVAFLEEYRRVLFEGKPPDRLCGWIEKTVLPVLTHEGEGALLRSLPECLDWLSRRPEQEQAELRAVLQEITQGQWEDCVRAGEPRRIAWLEKAADLERYTYLVAGCVGRFWTRLGDLHLRRWRDTATMSDSEMVGCGVRFGQALQLVNVLRDAPADLAAGRGYLPRHEIEEAGGWPPGVVAGGIPVSGALTEVARHWESVASEWLADGRKYLAALRSARMRLAVALPLRLAEETLSLLAAADWETRARGMKVPRKRVRSVLALEALRAWTGLGGG